MFFNSAGCLFKVTFAVPYAEMASRQREQYKQMMEGAAFHHLLFHLGIKWVLIDITYSPQTIPAVTKGGRTPPLHCTTYC